MRLRYQRNKSGNTVYKRHKRDLVLVRYAYIGTTVS